MPIKLTENQVNQILGLHFDEGVNGKELARRFDISDSLIYCILNGQIWKHLYEPFKDRSRPYPFKDTLVERFFSYLDKDGPIAPNLGTRCWTWTGGKDENGYGIIRQKGKNLRSHRVSMEIHLGQTSELCVLHHCDNPSCVNPDHLFWGTTLDNNQDRTRKGRGADRRGEKHPQAKLSESQVRTIKQRYLSGGITQEQLAREFGVKRRTVTNIVTGVRWQHLFQEPTI